MLFRSKNISLKWSSDLLAQTEEHLPPNVIQPQTIIITVRATGLYFLSLMKRPGRAAETLQFTPQPGEAMIQVI